MTQSLSAASSFVFSPLCLLMHFDLCGRKLSHDNFREFIIIFPVECVCNNSLKGLIDKCNFWRIKYALED